MVNEQAVARRMRAGGVEANTKIKMKLQPRRRKAKKGRSSTPITLNSNVFWFFAFVWVFVQEWVDHLGLWGFASRAKGEKEVQNEQGEGQ